MTGSTAGRLKIGGILLVLPVILVAANVIFALSIGFQLPDPPVNTIGEYVQRVTPMRGVYTVFLSVGVLSFLSTCAAMWSLYNIAAGTKARYLLIAAVVLATLAALLFTFHTYLDLGPLFNGPFTMGQPVHENVVGPAWLGRAESILFWLAFAGLAFGLSASGSLKRLGMVMGILGSLGAVGAVAGLGLPPVIPEALGLIIGIGLLLRR